MDGHNLHISAENSTCEDEAVALAGSTLTDTARAIAQQSHTGQVDKAGNAYIHHPERVAARVEGDLAKATAWLHDVLEDTAVDVAYLRAAGIPVTVIAAVEALTHRPGEPRERYYQRVREAGDLAVQVKLADVADNSDPERLALLEPETRSRLEAKYEQARAALASAHP